MKVRVKPKYESGSAVTYISRKQAMKKLQLSMRDFRRLCILKGIYPHVPNNKKKANKGTTDNKVFYYRKDINFLAHEPIIGKFREYKVFLKKYNKLKAKNEEGRIKVLHDNKPTYSLDHIVKERYPTFASALRDLDDALSLCFVFATLPYTKILKLDIINDCRRLSAEFLHYVIESQSLRNVFISIKGIYYQAEFLGEKVTWLVPHERGSPHVTDVDFSVLATFSEFYVAMLGFVNYRLFATQGLHYPPKIETGTNIVEADDEEIVETIYSLSKPIARKVDHSGEQEEDVQIDMFGDEDNAIIEKIKQVKAIKSLFKGCVFYLNRETPKEALTLIIRSCGGTVGWEGSGNDLAESNPEITHHIIDRPLKNVNVSRRYMQPQWVFDCLNARRMLPIDKYLPGVTLPPHFSPFIAEKPGDYIPVERLEELRSLGKDVEALVSNEPFVPSAEKKPKKKPVVVEEKKGMRAELGKMHKKNKQLELNQQGAENKMKEMMIARKHQRVYHSMKTKLKKDKNEAVKLKTKRAKIDSEKKNAVKV